MSSFKEILLWVWQVLQNILGLILLLFYKHEKLYLSINGRRFYSTQEMPSGISLGNYIILGKMDSGIDMKHEYGHSIQSRYLGPLYLLIIGLPSACGNLWDRWFHKKWYWEDREKWYYNLPWEKWADKLGGVKRDWD